MQVVSINLPARFAILDTGATVPITNLFDAWGDETDDLGEAQSFVCGSGRCWLSDLIDQFETVAVH